MSDSQILIFKNPASIAEAFAKNLKEWTAADKPFHLALSGGSTPQILFQYLSTLPADYLPWSRIHLWWGDERAVPADHAESNFGMTKTYLLDHISIPAENIHRVKGEVDPERAAQEYMEEITRLITFKNDWPVFDLIMLGMGDDGHTASIFPHEIYLLRSPQICAVATHPVSGQKRITLTGRVINAAEKVAFLVTGKNKTEKVSEIMKKLPEAHIYPAAYIQPTEGQLYWFLDYDSYGMA
ncbi:MAG: 6-phosphogluconolactonase [Bacteroidia bacterium]|nr:6-phosphogluconolactonase [Bacteroidia bacterium]